MRIVGGRHRGRRLATPPDDRIRPTSDRARESLFNVLAHGRLGRDGGSPLIEVRVLDAFCGTGALGLEALSRGAASATFLDRDEAALALVRANLAALGETARARLLRADATRPGRAPAAHDLALLDPPYGSGLAAPALAALAASGWLAPDALCVVEMQADEAFEALHGFAPLDERRYGRAKLAFLRWKA